MNEWGTPDWRDAEAYDAAETWNIGRWRWEFFRRRADVREYFTAHAQETYECNVARYQALHESMPEAFGAPPKKPNEPDFTARQIKRARNEPGCEELFGYYGVPNPRISEHCFRAISFIPANSVPITGEAYKPRDTERLLAFDLTKPIGPQIAHAKETLEIEQELDTGRVLQRRAHTAKWPDYLRALDAREDGASWQVIYDTVLKPTGRYSDKNPKKTASDVWEAARILQFNFPV